MNGTLVDWADARIHVASHVIHYGSGVFEGARCYDTKKGQACLRLDAHVKRLLSSARIYRMDSPYTQQQLEGAVLDTAGFVSEGSGENVFVVRDGILYTPPLSASILAGITREMIITLAGDLGYRVREELIPREMLYIADELFFAGTAVEITPVRSVDKIKVGIGRRGPVTEAIQRRFLGIVNGEAPDTHRWLTFVDNAGAAPEPVAAGAKAR
jgi:branched-subunit amino acid aminotransferase/4-amino-4-deoxychorismate lyase